MLASVFLEKMWRSQKKLVSVEPRCNIYKKPKTLETTGQSKSRDLRVPPIMPIKTIKKKGKKRQNRPSEIRLSGVPPIMPIKKQKTKKNTEGKIDPQKYVLQGSPL